MDAFEEGIIHFNEGRFKEAHEAWESVWMPLPASDRKRFLQGLIMLSAALYKFKRGEYSGMEKLLKKGVRLIRENRQDDFGIDVSGLDAEMSSFLNKHSAAQGRAVEPGMPKVRHAGSHAGHNRRP